MKRHLNVVVVEIGSTITKANGFMLDGTHVAQGFALTTISEGDVSTGMYRALDSMRPMAGREELFHPLAHQVSSGHDSFHSTGESNTSRSCLSGFNSSDASAVCNAAAVSDAPNVSVTWDLLLANSSAAGGLKMTVHGLTMDMTARAAREASLGAGAILRLVTAGRMKNHDLNRIRDILPNIILLAGGVDYGDQETVLHNARALAELFRNPEVWGNRESRIDHQSHDRIGCIEGSSGPPVIYAGNIAAWDEISEILGSAGARIRLTENVYPALDELNVEPARTEIMDVFSHHIIRAPGMGILSELAGGKVIPTPAAVMETALLLASMEDDLMIIDVGGATTDVHSVTDGSDAYRLHLVDPEPRAKRTVEGDLGVYVNASVLKSASLGRGGRNAPAGYDGSNDRSTDKAIDKVINKSGDPHDGQSVSSASDMPDLSALPRTHEQKVFSSELASRAVAIAMTRHAGSMKDFYTPGGRRTMVRGKDLTAVKLVIGTGGALTRLPGGREALSALCTGDATGSLMPSPDARTGLDRDYLFSAIGTIAHHDRDMARKCMESYLPRLLEQ
ncbi:MAG: hypothetical protein CVV64_15175 [Candidatus Wallbacteria bacterium HGW-Wallbacteria-1]|jgi:hypothetical protein|uniref:DNA mismatch repair protein MutL n=1 Tax=Candidatus Wallbacteria bacterium HGW-Wallbacteria-1 TaxID=2013854 RepID=A0A2N1PLP9_9BACT|nr:MAG: hypothetical protein CVV64_15175 [Candidatus Wallbacteria bacterium HGW-Wallbacteria-1]